ncbi:hypothetical protein GRI33_06175 [Brucella sp. BO3]|uniref:hypothetical protein n=1 Tax=unclassified Brucella TaxID=2632610 RepID=UPI00084F9293|nr:MULTISPECIES: hypothetical protein [unclassified Brucella]OEI83703.1 hypothetical protein BA060_06920 [Brucella sp. B13-0095]QMV26536.1 hypothetical protein GRI33_06175 [Brucella sp. BO3]
MTNLANNLIKAIEAIGDALADADRKVGPFDGQDYSAWRERQRKAEAEVVQFLTDSYDAKFKRSPSHDSIVRILGIRASSTSGTAGALRNWMTAASKRIAAEGGAHV